MPRRATPLEPGCHYHIYNRGCSRGAVFFERQNYAFFLRQVRQYLGPILDVVAYCLMPSHYHMLVSLKTAGLSHGMQLLGISYTKAINEPFDRVGPLFQGSFRAKLVDRDEYLVHLSCYIHLNPVDAGLVGRPEEWEFSSYREYAGLRDGSLPAPEIVLSQFSSRAAYRRLVEEYGLQDEGLIAGLLFD